MLLVELAVLTVAQGTCFTAPPSEQTALQPPWRGMVNGTVIEVQSNKSSLQLCFWASQAGTGCGC